MQDLTMPASGDVPPGGVGVSGVYLFSPQQMAGLASALAPGQVGEVRLQLSIEGRVLDGMRVSSAAYGYRLLVCPTCPHAIGTPCPAGTTGVACAPGQDSGFVCLP
jgi:hypothetical protein